MYILQAACMRNWAMAAEPTETLTAGIFTEELDWTACLLRAGVGCGMAAN